MPEIKLTQLSHGGGCGCKIAPALLQEILGKAKDKLPFSNLMVGTETSDDAAVYRLNDQQAIIATTDFSCPSSTTRSTLAASPRPTRCPPRVTRR